MPILRAPFDGRINLPQQKPIDAGDQLRCNVAFHRERLRARQWLHFIGT
jgi:hypothetical protein